jgi:hypothetical protein
MSISPSVEVGTVTKMNYMDELRLPLELICKPIFLSGAGFGVSA